MRKVLLLSGLLFFISLQLSATHNRAGEIVYKKLPGNSLKYEISIITYTKISSPITRDSLLLEIYYCPKGSEPLDEFWVLYDSETTIMDDVRRRTYTLEAYTFPGPGCYRLAMSDPTRTDDIINMSRPVDQPFYLEDTLMINDPQFLGFNSSPVLLQHPIVFAGQYLPFTHNPGAFDPDGDSLVFSLIEPLRRQGDPVDGYTYPDDPVHTNSNVGFPNEFSINSQTGELTWEVPHVKGKYNVAILIREFREGTFVGSMMRDLQIWVTDSVNHPPVVTNLKDTCVIAGSKLQASLQADDPDNDNITSFTGVGGPFAVDDSPATWNSGAPAAAPVTGTFEWNTNCSHVRKSQYVAVFTAEDDYKPGGKLQPFSDAETWLIRVVGPPPQNLQTSVDQPNDRIRIEWDSLYACDQEAYDNFVGFSVWRKRGCDSTQIDRCSPGNLKAKGYKRISDEKPIDDAYHFYDNTASVGVVYSYRVQAEFGEQVPNSQFYYNQVGSIPSNASCAQLKSDIPVITHADVRTTDTDNGEVMVKWYPPDAEALDTTLNSGPYRYELYSHDGLGKGSNTSLLNTYSAQQFYQLAPDSFLHKGINTLDEAHTYSIIFYATDADTGEYRVGETEGASTVFLQTTASNKQIVLNWNETVPWANYKYEIYRLHVDSTAYELIATTTEQEYYDQGLTNLLEYCYYVRSFGSYSNDRLPDPLINNSQRLCDVPRDTVPPCPPGLTVTNNCEDVDVIDPGNFENQLSWSDPRLDCDDLDLAGYKIYYAPTSQEPLELLATYDDPDNQSFTHDNLNSLAGCYAVTAVDSFGNESLKSNETCLDNCPLYELPNTFTPNGDGKNDRFTPIKPYYFIDHVEMKIYNRWGNLVYQTSDPEINWDGTDMQTGEPVPEGAYHYVCEVYEERVSGVVRKMDPLSGYIQLVRGN